MDWFASRLLDWFDRHGRKDLPWQQDKSPYRVWVAEIMLQQTQVATVIPYYQRFMARFADVEALAAANLDEVLHHWTGLGYYARARNLHKAANVIVRAHGKRFPEAVDELAALPGIGRSTAGAISAIAFRQRAPILDGNVKRVLTRFHAIEGHPSQSGVAARLWSHADAHTPAIRVADYTQAIMDLGATLCSRSRPDCPRCPLSERCAAHAAGTATQFPTPRSRRALSVRAVRMYLIVDESGNCLLERRPETGIWGGLWTPPERSPTTALAAVLAEFGLPAPPPDAVSELPGFRHTFTHFHLDVAPLRVQLAAAEPGIADRPDLCWYSPIQPKAIGLSAPAAKMLAELAPTRAPEPGQER